MAGVRVDDRGSCDGRASSSCDVAGAHVVLGHCTAHPSYGQPHRKVPGRRGRSTTTAGVRSVPEVSA